MNWKGILKPEYYYQPHKLVQRLWRSQHDFVQVRLPWGMPIRARSQEEHGRILMTLGIVDLPVTELLWRLTDATDCAVDVGANIGCMSATLAVRAHAGRVVAFEAHPDLVNELRYNVGLWERHGLQTHFELKGVAVSKQLGSVILTVDQRYAANRGLATVAAVPNAAVGQFPVPATTLDHYFPHHQTVDMLKLDVEGHELQVLQGAEQLLRSQRLRDCIFEEHAPYPTPVTTLLESYGYQVWRIDRQFWSPVLADPASPALPSWLPTSYLATRNVDRVLRRLQAPGWQCLSHAARKYYRTILHGSTLR